MTRTQVGKGDGHWYDGKYELRVNKKLRKE